MKHTTVVVVSVWSTVFWLSHHFMLPPVGQQKNIQMRNRAIWWLYLISMVSIIQEVRLISKNWKIGNKDIFIFYYRYIPVEQGKNVRTTFYIWDGKNIHLFYVSKNGTQSLSSVFHGYASCQNCMCTFANFITFQNILVKFTFSLIPMYG